MQQKMEGKNILYEKIILSLIDASPEFEEYGLGIYVEDGIFNVYDDLGLFIENCTLNKESTNLSLIKRVFEHLNKTYQNYGELALKIFDITIFERLSAMSNVGQVLVDSYLTQDLISYFQTYHSQLNNDIKTKMINESDQQYLYWLEQILALC